MTNWRKLDYRGAWIPPLCLLIAGLAVLPGSPYRLWVEHVLFGPQRGDSVMRYLRKDVATGVSALSGAVLILLLGAFTWKRWWYWVSFAFLPSWFALAFPVAKACVILWRCFDLMDDPSKAQAVFRDDRLFDRTVWVTFAVGFVCWSLLAAIRLYKSAASESRGISTT
jgi:hypothetical protein